MLLLVHEADSTGTSFRYSGQMPHIQESLDFVDLVAMLDAEFELLGGMLDGVTEMYAAGPQPEHESDWY